MEKLHRRDSPDASSRDRIAFLSELRQFHSNRSTSFRHAPRINGREMDLHKLYYQVTALGGLQKVNDGHKWDIVQEAIGMPTACANANLALRQLYIRYLSAYEKIHYLGEDPDDDNDHQSSDTRSRKNPTGVTQGVPMSYNYLQHELTEYQRTAIGMCQDFVYPNDYDKLRLSLLSGLPNEQDFALNVMTLLSNEGKNVMHLERMPKLVDLLVAQTGIWPAGDPSVQTFYLECWKDIEGREMHNFWENTINIEDPEVRELWTGNKEPAEEDYSELFNNSHLLGCRNTEGQRVLRVALILYNLSFESHNVSVLAKNATCLRFILLCIYSRWSYLRQVGLDTLGNLAGQIKLSMRDLSTRLIMRTVTEGVESNDRYVIIRSLEILARLSQYEENDDIITSCIELSVYQRIVSLVTLQDVMLLVYSLEALYALSELGRRVCEKIVRVHRAVGTLVSLLTIESEPSSNYKLVETFETTTTTLTTTTTVVPPQSSLSSTPQQSHFSPSTSAVAGVASLLPKQQASKQLAVGVQEAPPICGPTEIPLKRTAATPLHGPEMDSESVACNWLKSFYEMCLNHGIPRNELYADYVSYCSGVGRRCVVNANVFANCVRTVFPQSGLKRIESGNGNITLTHDCLKQREVPLPAGTVTYQVRHVTKVDTTMTSGGKPTRPVPGKPSHSPILKAHLSSPLRSLTPPLVNPSPPPSPSPANTNLIKSLLANKVTKNIQKSQVESGAVNGRATVASKKAAARVAGIRINGAIKELSAEIKMEMDEGKPLVNHHSNVIQNHHHSGLASEESNSSECADKELMQSVLAANSSKVSNGLPTIIKNESGTTQYVIPVSNNNSDEGGHQNTTIPRIIVISNNNNNSGGLKGNEIGGSLLMPHFQNAIEQQKLATEQQQKMVAEHRTLTEKFKFVAEQQTLVAELPRTVPEQQKMVVEQPRTVTEQFKFVTEQKMVVEQCKYVAEQKTVVEQQHFVEEQQNFVTEQQKLAPEQLQADNNRTDDDSFSNRLVKSASFEGEEEDVKRRKQELYKTSPLLNGLLDKGKSPLPGETENCIPGLASEEEEKEKVVKEPPHRPVVVKEDILSTAMAFAELDDEPLLDGLTGDDISSETATLESASGDCIATIVDGSTTISSVANPPAVVRNDLSSISDIARTLECASKAISRTNAECQLPFVAVSSSGVMPATHIVSVVRINPQAITLPVMSGAVGQQIVQAHILRLQSPTIGINEHRQEQQLIRLPSGQLAQLQLQPDGAALLGSTLVSANALKRPSNSTQTCFVLETKRPRQDLVQGSPTTTIAGTKTPLLEASLRQSGLVLTSGTGTTQVLTVPVMSADGQLKQGQTFHLALPKIQPKQESNFQASPIRTVTLVTTSATLNNPTVTFVGQTVPVQTVAVTTIRNTASVATCTSIKPNIVNKQLVRTVPVVKATTVTNSSSVAKPVVMNVKAETKVTKPGQATVMPKLKYLCEWKNCMRAFATAGGVLMHVSSAHMPADMETLAVCQWDNCDTMKRKKLSLLTHMQDRHCSEQLLQLGAIRRHQVAQFGKSTIPAPPAPPPHPGYAPDAALLAIRRHALQYLNPKEFQDEKEGSLTKSIRLTAALVIRNLAVYCPSACSQLRQYESELSGVAMSTLESSRTVAQCLLELARPPLGQTVSNTSSSFVPAL